MSSSVFTAHARTNLPSRGIGGGVVEVEGNTALAFQENGERFHDTAMERIVELKYYYKLLYPVRSIYLSVHNASSGVSIYYTGSV